MKPRLTMAALVASLALSLSHSAFAQQPSAPSGSADAPHGAHHGPTMQQRPGQHHGPSAGHAHRGPEGLMMPGARMLQGLDLTEAQRDKVFGILHAQAPAMRKHAIEARKARAELQNLALAGELDEARLQSSAERASRAMADLAMLRTRTHNAVFRELTPEQQAQVRARMAQHGHGAPHGRPGRGPDAPGAHHG